MEISLVGGAYEGISKFTNPQTCINFYVEVDHAGGNNALVGFPGLESRVNLYDAVSIDGKSEKKEVRGMHQLGDYLYAVVGNFFVRIDKNEDVDIASSSVMDTDEGAVTIEDNGYQIMICDGTDKTAYVYDTSTTNWHKILDSNYSFYGGNSVASQDGYLISDRPGTDRFYFSTLDNALLSWDVTDFISANVEPGDTVRIISSHRTLWAFKEKSIEARQNTGSVDRVFDLIPGGYIDVGCAATHSVAKIDNTLYFLANDKTIRRMAGVTPQIISTEGVAYQISQYETISDARAFGYIDNNKTFYQITFPTEGETWVYEVSSGIWVKRASYKERHGQDAQHRASAYAFFNNKHYCGDYDNGYLYEMRNDIYTDNGNRIIAERTIQTLDDRNIVHSYPLIALEAEMGVGNAVAPAVDPQVMMQVSKDDGNTWGNERWKSLGKTGEFKNLVRWRQNGRARNLTIRLRVSDPVKRVFKSLNVPPIKGLS